MKVLALSNLYPPHAYGGYEWTCFDTMQVVAAAGHDVKVLTSTARINSVSSGSEPQVERVIEPWWDWHRQQHLELAKTARVGIARRNHRTLTEQLDRFAPDVVSVWHMGGLGLNLLTAIEQRGIPMVAMIEDDWMIYGSGLDVWTRTFDRRRSLGRLAEALVGVPTRAPELTTTKLVFASRFTRDKTDRQSAYRTNGCDVVPLGVDTTDFPLQPAHDRPWSWRLLYVGRLARQKGIETLVRAFAQLPVQAHLELIGDGDLGYRPSFEALIDSLGVRDRITIRSAARSELARSYRDADLVLFPSEWDEPFGIVPLEAMASATPLIATGVGGSGEFLEDGRNCRLVPPGDVDALIGAINTLAGDAGERRRLVDGGRQTASELTMRRFTSTILEILETEAARKR